MDFNRKFGKLAGLAVVGGLSSYGNPLLGAEVLSDQVLYFEVKPLVCIVEKVGESCQLKSAVNWQTRQAMDVCLMDLDEMVYCWRQTKSGSKQVIFDINEARTIFLVTDNKQLLASETLEVNAVNPQKSRRRLRSAWSLF